jgi:predicted permease
MPRDPFGLRRASGSRRVGVSVAAAIALGVGACIAVLSVLHNVFVESPPYVDVNALVILENHGAYDLGVKKVERPELSWPDFGDLQAQQHTFLGVEAVSGAERTVWDPGERARSVRRMFVTQRLMPLLGVRARLGRTLSDGDFESDAPPVGVITAALWRRQFGSDPHVSGRTVRLDGLTFTLVGVVPDDVVGFLRERKEVIEEADLDECVLLPLVSGGGGRMERLLALRRQNRTLPMLTVVGRLRPSVSLEAARADVRAISGRLARDYPATNSGREIRLLSLTDWQTRGVAHVRPMLLAVAILALLVACASAIGLMMTDAVRRQPEMAVRHALGATRSHLMRLVLQRAIGWTFPGGLVGIVFARQALRWINVGDRADSSGLHLPAGSWLITAALGLAVLCGLALGLVGLWVLRQQDLTPALKEGGQSMSLGRRRRLILGVLAAIEIATATSLGFVSVLLLRSMANIYNVELGFDAGQSFVVRLLLPEEYYGTPDDQSRYFERALSRVRAVPGVESAGLSDAPPLSQIVVTMGGELALEIPSRGREPLAPLVAQRVSPGYVEAVGMRMVRGRAFSEEDARGNAPVVLVDEAFARIHLGSADPLHSAILMGGRRLSIIGIAADVRYDGPVEAARPTLYVPRNQGRSMTPLGHVVVRPSGVASGVMSAVVDELARMDRRVVIDDPQTLASLFEKTIVSRQRMLRLLTVAAVIVLLLTAFSVGGTIGEFVENKTREIALRKALGASSAHTIWLVFRYVGGPCCSGLALGCVGGWALARTLSGELFGIAAADPSSVVAVVVGQVVLGMLAAAAPLRRALWIDPARTLRAM